MPTQKPSISPIGDKIDRIVHLVNEIANGDFTHKLPNQGDELDGLVDGINKLGDRLKSSTVSKDFMESVYKGVVDLLFVLTPDFKISRINDAVEKDLKYTQLELLGQPFQSIVKVKDYQVVKELRKKVLIHNTLHNVELTLIKRNGQRLETSASLSTLYDNQRNNMGTLVIAKDISELKNTATELLQAKENAELANKSKTSFLANMSHEIRTPLNGIMGFIYLLMETKTDSTQNQYLNLIKGSGESLSKLLNDILDLNKVEQGKLVLERIPFNFQKSVLETINPFKFIIEEKGINFRVKFDDDLPRVVVGDPSRFNQIIRNLLANALKFTESGEIAVEFKCLKQNSRQFILQGRVIDTGLGIPKEKQKLIFESFTQADDSTTRKYGGTGLGLSIISHLTELMSGQVSVQSPPRDIGRTSGTAFTFRVRLDKGKVSDLQEEPLLPEKMQFSRAYNILVVDDNDINLTLCKKVLENLGAEVELAKNGEEAVNMALANSYDLILMDIQMPVLDGYEATQSLRSQGYHTPIFALSANTYQEQIDKCISSGMNSHIKKPFTKKDIFTNIESVMLAYAAAK
ncbi:MAG: PAS domain S-box-containing protein [Cyclobacteriaceae bacterium]|jgi:PAS domain S-box-containing protein